MEISQILNIELPYDPTILVLGITPKELKTVFQRHTCIPIFIGLTDNDVRIHTYIEKDTLHM